MISSDTSFIGTKPKTGRSSNAKRDVERIGWYRPSVDAAARATTSTALVIPSSSAICQCQVDPARSELHRADFGPVLLLVRLLDPPQWLRQQLYLLESQHQPD